jgi:hypothetical protein
MKHTLTRRIAVGAVATALSAGLVALAPASADAAPSAGTTAGSNPPTTQASNPGCTPALFSQAQQLVEANLKARVAQLNTLSAEVDNSANHLTTGDRQTLVNDITTVELPGIQTLLTQVQSVTTCPALRAIARSMVYNYRVYVVMTPQTHLTIVMDDETSIEGVFVNLEPQIATAIQNAQTAGKNVTAAQAAFTDLKNQVSTAQGETNGQSATILAQTPTGFPGNWGVFQAARTNATNAHTDLRSAYSDAQQIRTDLQ